jgi:AraC-like DNA-binding protein
LQALARHEICVSTDLDEFRDRLCGVYYPARVETLDRRVQLQRSRLCAATLQHLTFGYVRFGAPSVVDVGALTHSYHVNVPLSGEVASMYGHQETVATPQRAAVFGPTEHTVLPRWSADAAQFCLRIDRMMLERELEAMLDRPVGEIRFDIGFDLDTEAAQSWLATVRLLASEFDRAGSLLEEPSTQAYFERLIMTGLLLAHRHNYSDALRSPRRPAPSRAVKKALELIESHPEQSVTVADLARASGVSTRSLQAGFMNQLDMSPMAYLREVRLRRAHAELEAGGTTVTDAAYRAGFTHLSRFAELYRQRFGVCPSETLRH